MCFLAICMLSLEKCLCTSFLIFDWIGFVNNFIYFWLCWVLLHGLFSLVAEAGGYFLIAVPKFLIGVASLVDHGLPWLRLLGSRTQAQ